MSDDIAAAGAPGLTHEKSASKIYSEKDKLELMAIHCRWNTKYSDWTKWFSERP
jgi:hypothetical protein